MICPVLWNNNSIDHRSSFPRGSPDSMASMSDPDLLQSKEQSEMGPAEAEVSHHRDEYVVRWLLTDGESDMSEGQEQLAVHMFCEWADSLQLQIGNTPSLRSPTADLVEMPLDEAANGNMSDSDVEDDRPRSFYSDSTLIICIAEGDVALLSDFHNDGDSDDDELEGSEETTIGSEETTITGAKLLKHYMSFLHENKSDHKAGKTENYEDAILPDWVGDEYQDDIPMDNEGEDYSKDHNEFNDEGGSQFNEEYFYESNNEFYAEDCNGSNDKDCNESNDEDCNESNDEDCNESNDEDCNESNDEDCNESNGEGEDCNESNDEDDDSNESNDEDDDSNESYDEDPNERNDDDERDEKTEDDNETNETAVEETEEGETSKKTINNAATLQKTEVVETKAAENANAESHASTKEKVVISKVFNFKRGFAKINTASTSAASVQPSTGEAVPHTFLAPVGGAVPRTFRPQVVSAPIQFAASDKVFIPIQSAVKLDPSEAAKLRKQSKIAVLNAMRGARAQQRAVAAAESQKRFAASQAEVQVPGRTRRRVDLVAKFEAQAARDARNEARATRDAVVQAVTRACTHLHGSQPQNVHGPQTHNSRRTAIRIIRKRDYTAPHICQIRRPPMRDAATQTIPQMVHGAEPGMTCNCQNQQGGTGRCQFEKLLRDMEHAVRLLMDATFEPESYGLPPNFQFHL